MNKLSALVGGGKPRLYMAFYRRGQQFPGDVKYHTALLLIPKGANPESTDLLAIRYHAINRIADGQQVWKFETTNTRLTTHLLCGLVFLGKVAISSSELEKIMEEVPVINGDPVWRCCHWIWSAVNALVREGVIDAVPSSPETIWQMGMDFADENPVDPTTGIIPTCTTTGDPTRSALEGA
ncbi:hypothetical protein FPV67DRAFT_1504606 [Lyophyllum atratum]|nr:hypothetical protein FPV67DRAFT_1504606 [Lyophyllum atratum]